MHENGNIESLPPWYSESLREVANKKNYSLNGLAINVLPPPPSRA